MAKYATFLILLISTSGNSAPVDSNSLISRLHSQNDSTQSAPLVTALQLGIHSVQANIWYQSADDLSDLFDGISATQPSDFYLSQNGFEVLGTLEDIYLDPLTAQVASHHGSVLADRQPFFLWLNINQNNNEIAVALHSALTRFSDLLGPGGPVQIVLTGQGDPKAFYLKNFSDLAVSQDANDLDALQDSNPSPLPALSSCSWESLDWDGIVSWNGIASMPYLERIRLRSVVSKAHQLNRRVRLYNVPQTNEAWTESYDAGVDLIGAEDLSLIQSLNSSVDASGSPVGP